MTYPGARVSIADAPRILRSSEICRCTCVTAVTGAAPEYRSSASRSTETTRFALRSRIASVARCFGPPRRDGAVVADHLERPQDAELEHSGGR